MSTARRGLKPLLQKTFYNCCHCYSGPMLLSINPACPGCQHRACGSCAYEPRILGLQRVDEDERPSRLGDLTSSSETSDTAAQRRRKKDSGVTYLEDSQQVKSDTLPLQRPARAADAVLIYSSTARNARQKSSPHASEPLSNMGTNNGPSGSSETGLNAEEAWVDRRFEMGEASTRTSALEPKRLITAAASADVKFPSDVESDEESIAPSVFSEKSEDTMATTSTDFPGEATAAQELFLFIAYDSLLRPLFEGAQEEARFSANVFEAKMKVLLKKFARDLRIEAKTRMQRKAIPFLSQRAGFVARRLTSLYYWQEASFVPVENDSEDGEDGGDGAAPNQRHTDSDFEVLFSHVRHFLSSSAAFSKLRETLGRLLKPEQPSWAAARDQWERELRSDLPVDVLLGCSVKVIVKDNITWADKFKSALEACSGEEWLWGCFEAPRRPIPEGKVRLQWQCSCESILWEDVSPALARNVQRMHQTESSSKTMAQAGVPPVQPSQTADSATVINSNTGTMAGTCPGPSASSQGNMHAAGGPNTAANLTLTPASSSQYSSRVLFVLLCVPCGWFRVPELKNSVIEIPESQDDDAFFQEFRKHYRSARGFMHYWFDVRQFSFCHASRFEKWDVDSLGWCCNEMPPDQDTYEYVPQPPAKPYERILTKHEWWHRFHRPARTRGLQRAFDRMPKRKHPFQISMDASREYVWGFVRLVWRRDCRHRSI